MVLCLQRGPWKLQAAHCKGMTGGGRGALWQLACTHHFSLLLRLPHLLCPLCCACSCVDELAELCRRNPRVRQAAQQAVLPPELHSAVAA